jgi:hypothetical protein
MVLTNYGKDLCGVNTYFFQPTIITSFPIHERIKTNISISEIIFMEKAASIAVFTLGTDIAKIIDHFILRPEIGVASNGSIRGFYYSLSMGISYKTTKDDKKCP